MRIPTSLHIVAGVAILVLLLLTVSVTEGKRTERNKQEEKAVKEESNDNGVQKKPTIFSFIRGLFPNPERTLENLKAVAASSRPKAKSMEFTRNKNAETSQKNKKNAKKVRVVQALKKSGKPAVGTSRLRLIPTSTTTTTTTTTPRPKKIHQKKTSATTTTKVPPKTKSAKLIKDRPRTTAPSASHVAPPSAKDMVILTHDQKRDRLRQELVKETEDNCLAKILCGGGKPKPKDKNTFVSDSAYLIKEFFNIFDFTVDGYGEFDKNKEVEGSSTDTKKTSSNDKPQSDEGDEDEEEDEDDDTDDEEDEIYRKEQGDTASKKYAPTTKPQQPVQAQKTRTSKPMSTFLEREDPQIETRRPKPIATTTRKTTTTTDGTTTSTTIRPSSKEDGYGSILTGGDMAPFIHKFNMMHKDRLGEAVTHSSNNVLTNTMISTSMSGSATLKPLDYPFEIPLKTAKDDSDGDDDEEDDNNKYDDDGSTYHRVTLEELVGDIKLTAADLAMLRRGRSMKVNVNNITSDRYIKSKLRQLKQVNNEVQKLRIAQKIGRSMREPRQCRQFSQVAQEVLQTCPLTTEVIRFFNANLRNGSSIEVKKTPATSNSTGAGLVLLGNDQDGSQQTYLVDNNGPPSSNINLESDLKNPSIPSSYGKDEDQYHVYEKRPNPNPQHANLNQHGQDITKRPAPPKKDKDKEADSEEEQDDEGDSEEDEEEEEEDDAEGRRVQQNYRDQDTGDDDAEDEEEEDDYDDGSAEDDEDGSDDNSNNKIKIQGNHEQIQGPGTNQPNFQVAFRPKPYNNRPKPQGPTLPPGIIRVYGVPQASFDKDFTTLADQLGPKPVTFFGEEDIDRPAYKRRRQLPTEDDDEKEDLDNVAYSSRIPKHPPLESEAVNDGDDDDDDHITTKKPYKNHKKKNNGSNKGKPLGGLQGAGDDDDDDDDDHKKGGHSQKKKKKGHSIESVDLNEYPFSTSGFYNPAQDYFHHHQQENYHHHQHQHHHPHHYQGPHHHQYGYRPIVRPIQIIPDVQVPVPFRPTRANMRPGRLYPLYGKK